MPLVTHYDERILALLEENARALREVQAMLSSGNGKTAIAVLTERMDHLSDDMGELCQRMSEVGRGVAEHRAEIAVLRDRMNLLAGLQATLALVASSVATFLGTRN